MSFAPEVAFHLTSPNDFFSDNSQSVLMFDLLTVLPMEGLCSRLTLKLTGKTDQSSSFSGRDWSKYFSNIFAMERLSLRRCLWNSPQFVLARAFWGLRQVFHGDGGEAVWVVGICGFVALPRLSQN